MSSILMEYHLIVRTRLDKWQNPSWTHLSNRITKVSQEHRLWTEILPVWQNPVKAATYFKSVVPAGSCTLVQGAKIYGHLYTCISIKIEPNNQVKARWMVRRVINIKTGLMTKTAIKMRTKMTAKTMEGDNGIKTHSYHAVWGGVYPFVFLGQWQRQWHSAIDDGRDNDKHNGKDDGRGQWRLWTGACLKIL